MDNRERGRRTKERKRGEARKSGGELEYHTATKARKAVSRLDGVFSTAGAQRHQLAETEHLDMIKGILERTVVSTGWGEQSRKPQKATKKEKLTDGEYPCVCQSL